MGLFTGLSETKIAKEMLKRTNGFVGSYDLLKNAVVGTQKKTVEFIGHSNNSYDMSKIQLVEIEPISSALGIPESNYDKESCKVWDIFTPLSAISHLNSEYGAVALKYKSNSNSTRGAFSLIRLSKISCKNNYINILYDGGITMCMAKPTIFIVLDDPNYDGEIFNFIVNIKFEATTNTYTSEHIPSVIFIDGRYSNISIDNNSEYIIIDGIKYSHVDKKDYIRDKSLDFEIAKGVGYSKYSRDYYNQSVDKYHSGLISGESFLLAISRIGQIFNNIDDQYAFKFTPFNVKNYDNYGSFNNSQIKTYSTNNTYFILETKDNLENNDSLVVSNTDNTWFTVSSNKNGTYVFGKNTNTTQYNYDTISTDHKLSEDEHVVIHSEKEYPNQFNITNSTPFDSIDSGLNIKFNAFVERKNANNSIGSINIIKTGLKGTKYSFVLMVGRYTSSYYIDGISDEIKNVELTYDNDMKFDVRFKSDLNRIYIRAQFSTPIVGNTQFKYDSDWKYLCEASEITAENWNNYIELLTIKKGSESEEYDKTSVGNIIISNNMSREDINSYSDPSAHKMSYDLDDDNVDFNRKILSLHDINGYLLKVEPNYVTTIPTYENPTIDQLSFKETTYKVSFIYNKHKGDAYYELSKNYKLLTDKLISNKMSSSTYEGDTKCSLIDTKIGFSNIGTIDMLSGNSYYTKNIDSNSFLSTLYSGNKLWGPNTTINNSHCGEVATLVKNPNRTEIHKKVNTFYYDNSDILISDNTGMISLVDSTYELLRHFEGTASEKTNIIVENSGTTKEYDRKFTNIGTTLMYNFTSYGLTPEEESYFNKTSAQMYNYISNTSDSSIWKARSVESHVDFEYYFDDLPESYLTESELNDFVSGGIKMISIPNSRVDPWTAKAGAQYLSEYYDGNGCKYGTTIMTKPLSYKWNGTTEPYYNVNTTRIYVAYDGTIVTGNKQVNSQTINPDGSYTNVYKYYSILEYTDPDTKLIYPGVTTIMYQNFSKDKEPIGGHYYSYLPNTMIYRVDSVKFSIMNSRGHLDGWHRNTLTRLSFDGSNPNFLISGQGGFVNVYVGNTVKIGHKLKIKTAKITPQYCAIYFDKLVTIDTGYSTVYKKLEAEKVPSNKKLTSNYAINIDYRKLESEYDYSYRDDISLKEGWKLFNYYQYPNTYTSNVTK